MESKDANYSMSAKEIKEVCEAHRLANRNNNIVSHQYRMITEIADLVDKMQSPPSADKPKDDGIPGKTTSPTIELLEKLKCNIIEDIEYFLPNMVRPANAVFTQVKTSMIVEIDKEIGRLQNED